MQKKKSKLPLSKTHPKLAKEAYGWDPATVTHGTARNLNWKCPEGHIFSQSPNYRTRLDNRPRKNKRITNSQSGKVVKNCPVCKGSTIVAGLNDLASQSPLIAKEAFGWDPSIVAKHSGLKFNWMCSRGHVYSATIDSRTSRGTGCPICAGKKVFVGFNDLKSTHPELSQEADGWDPKMYTAGSNVRKQWKCNLGHKFTTLITLRTRLWPGGCPVCAGKIALKGFNDLATLYPEIAKEAYGWDPTTVTRGNTKKLKWKCLEGHIFVNNCNSRTHLGRSCPICANQVIQEGYNDLKTTHPDIAKRANGWDPSKVFAGTIKKYEWKCENGHIWRADVNSQKNSSCPTCANKGYDPNDRGYLYFLAHSDWQMFQIGISNIPERRLNEHKKLGWEVIDVRGPMDGHLTRQWETAILRMLKANGADLANSKIAGKFDGYSESWSESTFPVKSIKDLMRLTEKFEDSYK